MAGTMLPAKWCALVVALAVTTAHSLAVLPSNAPPWSLGKPPHRISGQAEGFMPNNVLRWLQTKRKQEVALVMANRSRQTRGSNTSTFWMTDIRRVDIALHQDDKIPIAKHLRCNQSHRKKTCAEGHLPLVVFSCAA